MPSRRLAALLGAGLLASAPAFAADEPKPKEKPKAPPRVAVADPVKAKEDPDFAVQGEYEGTAEIGGEKQKIGAQVVAGGDGKFTVVAFKGGLPGAGWDGSPRDKGPVGTLKDGKVVLTDPSGKEVAGEIAGGTLTFKTDKASGTLSRVERTSPTLGAKPPEGAVVLFAAPGDEKTNWDGAKITELSDGTFLGVGEKSKQKFGAFKAHVEFRLPWMPNSRGQGRANSGVYPQDRYEIQVLDSFGLSGENNECGGIYTLHKPKVNMCLPPLAWQTYDIDFTPAGFDADGKKTTPARLTVVHNGVTVQDNVELKGPTGGGQGEKPTPGPLQFQNHGDPVVYRNVWVVEKK